MIRAKSPAISRESTQIKSRARLHWLDALRGLIMVLMAIDHASYFIDKMHWGEFWGIPLPDYGGAAPFLTRFITHFCAPGFFLLMGVGMVLFADSRFRRGWTQKQVIRHFAVRGGLLILFQITLENGAWVLGDLVNPVHMSPVPGGGEGLWLHFGVLYALGAAMIIWGLLMRVNVATAVLVSLGAILSSQFFVGALHNPEALHSPLLRMFFVPGQTNFMQVYYPIFPWVGLAGIGVVFGKVFLQDKERAYKGALGVGAAFVILFVLLRALGGFGNFHSPAGTGWIDFLNLTKYPPSLTFILLTIGGNLLALYFFHRVDSHLARWGEPLLVFGRTPLFFYILHLYLYAVIGFAFPTGTSIGVMYFLWILGLIILYPACKWYGRFKRSTAPNSVWRFL